jgi:poly(A) polymerase
MSSLDSLAPDWLAWPETKQLTAAFSAHKNALRFVGGAVRDSLLSRTVHDVDAATTCHPEQTMATLHRADIKALPTGIAHGTVTAVIGKKSFEITTLRKDMACDGRHADVAFTDDWKQDAARRDFTMNALYLTPEGVLFDYFGGVDDARSGCVRFIGDAQARISEDYLRILRFFRFHARYGKLPPDAQALAACRAAAAEIGQLSGERVQKELLQLLAIPDAYKTLLLMQMESVLEHVFGFAIGNLGAFNRLETIALLTGQRMDAHAMLALFAIVSSLPQEEACRRMVDRLRLSNAHAHELFTIVRRCPDIISSLPEDRQKQLLRQMEARLFTYAVMVNWATGDGELSQSCPYARMVRLAATWDPPLFPVTGRDLLAANIKPGKDMGLLLARLEKEWEASGYSLTRKQLLARL